MVKTFTEKSSELLSKYVCFTCKSLVFSQGRRAWVCSRAYSLTDKYCGFWVDDIANIRIRMPDGCFMYLAEG